MAIAVGAALRLLVQMSWHAIADTSCSTVSQERRRGHASSGCARFMAARPSALLKQETTWIRETRLCRDRTPFGLLR